MVGSFPFDVGPQIIGFYRCKQSPVSEAKHPLERDVSPSPRNGHRPHIRTLGRPCRLT